MGNTDAENVKRKRIVSCEKRKKDARSEVGSCNRQVLRREREEKRNKRNKRTKKIDARPTDQGSECV
jgi:hypothetical protein